MRYALDQHAWTHAAAVSGSASQTTADRLILGLTDEQMRLRPVAGLNSIAWLIWHIARVEDVAINALVAGAPQVLERGGWSARLGLPSATLGTGMDDAEVEQVSRQVSIAALLDYRMAVGRRTREVIAQVQEADLDQPVDPARIAGLVPQGSITAPAAWLVDAWQGQPLRFFIAMPATAHSYLHLGEAWCIRTLLGAGGGR
jgi:hypothetical protein